MDYRLISLHEAVKSPASTPSIIRTIVNEQPDSLNSIIQDFTPLHHAIVPQPRIDIIFELLVLGADVNARSRKKWATPLHFAAEYPYRESYDAIKLLIRFGANVNLRCKENFTPLHQIMLCFHCPFLRLRDYGQIDSINFLLENGVYVNHVNGFFVSFLQVCCCGCRDIMKLQLEASKLLLKFGCKPEKNIILRITEGIIKPSIYCIQLVQLMMQYILVNEFKTNLHKVEKLIKFKQYDELLNLNFLSTKKGYEELKNYQNTLISELSMMLKHKIGRNLSLFLFISVRCYCHLAFNRSEEFLLYKVLLIESSNSYVCSSDLFQASIRHQTLLSLLCSIGICVSKPSFKHKSETTVMLNDDAILHITTYLLRNDIINLILAFRIPIEPKKKKNNNNKFFLECAYEAKPEK